MGASFVLKDKKEKGKKTPIFLLFSFNSQRIKISTKESIEPKYWDDETQKVMRTLDVSNYQEINNNLAIIKKRANEIYENLVQECALSGRKLKPDDLKPDFHKFLLTDDSLSRNQEKLSFFEYFERFIRIRFENKKVGDKSIFIYRRAYSLLWDFQYDTNERVAFERFNLEFSIRFRKYLEEHLGFSPNTIKKHFKVIRTILNNAVTDNYHINPQYMNDDFMPNGEEVFDIALTYDEVEALRKYDFSNNKRLGRVRDLFVVGCYTGLRFSDLSRLGKEHLSGDLFTIVQKKTRKKNPMAINIPILEPVREILERYNYKLPNDISNQKMNEYLKEMAKETNLFNGTVSYNKTKAGKTELVSNPKYQEITTHTARRTYCTMCYNIGIPTHAIMAVSGHKTETAFLRYLKVTNKEHAKRSAEIWKEYLENRAGKVVKLNAKIS